MSKGRVLIAMSGGIDSSVAAILLKEQGYDLVGVTFRTWDYISKGCWEKETGCCSMDSIQEAKLMAEKLGFEHHVLDIRKEFNDFVINNFVDEYLAGRTPNPCVSCNSHIKWGEILKKADSLGCEFVATGHYAQIRNENGRYILSKGVDLSKDQSYFLWSLTQDNLKRTMFPLGGYLKPEIREIALERGFEKLSKKRESQEICFIPDNDYRKFLTERIPDINEKIGEGNFVDVEGKILGKHKGYPFYTIGQRKGLEIAVGHPLYVVNIDVETNTVILGLREDLLNNEMSVDNINLIKYDKIEGEIDSVTKIRYRDNGAPAVIKQEGDILKFNFFEKVSAIAPGQSAVFYEGDDVIGGGLIM